jgi:dihydroxy-acid dehydratase
MDAKNNVKGGFCNGQVGPEAAVGRPVKPVGAPGVIEIDAAAESLDVKLTDAELTERRTKWRPAATNHRSGAPLEYAQQVGRQAAGSTHPGGVHENRCHAYI